MVDDDNSFILVPGVFLYSLRSAFRFLYLFIIDIHVRDSHKKQFYSSMSNPESPKITSF